MEVRAPVRITRRHTLHLEGTPDRVFPMLCPVREVDYAEGWDPRLVISGCGLVERDCVFTTMDEGREATWVVTEHDPERHVVEMMKVIPGFTVTRLRIALHPSTPGQCAADITYTWTALSPEGEEDVRARTEDAWGAFMQAWDVEMNGYLRGRANG